MLTQNEILKRINTNANILKKYSVRKIGLFGSYVRNEQNENSDIDFLVEFAKEDFDNFMDLAFFLEDLFNCKVELITNESMSPYIKPYIEKEVRWYETEFAVS